MSDNIVNDLASIASEEEFADRAYAMTESWRSSGADHSAIDPVLSFIEAHPDWDLGSPGELVHFVEQYSGPAYADKLLASIRRRPTSLTRWMLNRVLNAETDANRRATLIQALVEVASTADKNSAVAEQARSLVEFQVKRH